MAEKDRCFKCGQPQPPVRPPAPDVGGKYFEGQWFCKLCLGRLGEWYAKMLAKAQEKK